MIGALLIYSLQERLTNSGFDEWGQVVLGAILVLVILFAPEGIYERLRTHPRRAVLAGATFVVATAAAAVAEWGIATDWLSTGLARRDRRPARRSSAPRSDGEALARELGTPPLGDAPAR